MCKTQPEGFFAWTRSQQQQIIRIIQARGGAAWGRRQRQEVLIPRRRSCDILDNTRSPLSSPSATSSVNIFVRVFFMYDTALSFCFDHFCVFCLLESSSPPPSPRPYIKRRGGESLQIIRRLSPRHLRKYRKSPVEKVQRVFGVQCTSETSCSNPHDVNRHDVKLLECHYTDSYLLWQESVEIRKHVPKQ